MDKNLHKDNLEQFFHDRLNQHGEDPDVDLWAAIEGQIPPKPPLPFIKMWLPYVLGSAAILAIVVLSIAYFQQQETIKTIVEKVEQQDATIKQYQENSRQNQNDNEPNSTLDIPQENLIKEGLSPTPPKNNIPTKGKNSFKEERQQIILPQERQKEGEVRPLNSFEKPSETVIPIAGKIGQKEAPTIETQRPIIEQPIEISILKLFEGLEQKTFTIPITPRLVDFTPVPLISERQQIKPNKDSWFIGIALNPQRGKQFIKGNAPQDMKEKIKRQESLSNSMGGELRIGKALTNRFRFYSGIGIQKVNLMVNHHGRLKYDPANEMLQPDGSFQNNYLYGLETSQGEVTINLPFKRPPNIPFQQGDTIPFRLNAQRVSTDIRIPLVGQYQLNSNKFSVGLKAGIVGRFQVQNEWQIRTYEPTRDPVRDNNRPPELVTPAKGKNQVGLGYLAGVNLTYQVNSKVDLFVEPTYESILIRNTPQHINARQDFASLQIGINYHF